MPKVLITVSPNELEASAMPTAEGRRAEGITREEILEALKAKGVVYGIDEAAVETLASSAATAPRVCLARGTPPKGGQAAEVELQFQDNTLVSAGQTVAILHPAQPGAPGRTVRGKELPARKTPERPLPAGENVEFNDADNTLRALVPGYVAQANHRIRVEPLVQVSSDRMKAGVRMYPLNGGEPGLTVADLEVLLREAGVVHGICPDAIRAVIQFLASAAGPTDWYVVAQGSNPIDGEDATLEFLVDAEAHVGLEMEDGRIDYRHRRESPPVSTGDLLVRKRPATPGTPGRTVTGEALSPRPGQDRNVLLGENVQASPDGLTYTAAIDGIVLRDGNRIRVINS
ncbi:MAG: flagellar assembly protein A, partial [Planctomycetota bacterium]